MLPFFYVFPLLLVVFFYRRKLVPYGPEIMCGTQALLSWKPLAYTIVVSVCSSKECFWRNVNVVLNVQTFIRQLLRIENLKVIDDHSR